MQKPYPFNLIVGQKSSAQTQFVDDLPINVSPILTKILNADGFMQQEPGLTQYGAGLGEDRGGVWNDNFQMLFRVSGNSLISVSQTGAVTVLGTNTVSIVAPQAAMPYSFNTQAVVVDGNYYLYDPVNGARQITDPDVGNPLDCVWVDGYYFFTDGEYLYHTDLNDESAIDPLKYATSEFSPDRTLGVGLTTDDKVIAFNRFTIEFFENEATEFFAFSRIPSRNVQYGIIGTYAKAQIGGQWYFMGGSNETNVSIFALGVGTATNISTRKVDGYIGGYSQSELQYASLETRVINNYPYLLVHLPSITLMCNLKVLTEAGADKAWCILQSGTSSGYPYRAIHGVFDPRRAQWVYGDISGSQLGYVDFDVATHYGDKVECLMNTALIYLESQSIDEIMIQTIPGFTATSDATVFFSLTYDGVTWSNEVSLQYGEPSAYNQRFMARRLGYVRNYFAMRFRWISESRMAFASGVLLYG